MARSTTKELTSGSPMKLILGFAVPLLFGMLFQQFYSLMDTIIVGRYLGVTALAAVGATGSINFLIIGFCQGICNGFGLPVAQRFGARDGGDGIKLQLGLPVIGIELAPVVHLHLSGIDGGKGEGITDAITPLALPAAGGHITGLGRQGAQQQGKQVVAGHTRAP